MFLFLSAGSPTAADSGGSEDGENESGPGGESETGNGQGSKAGPGPLVPIEKTETHPARTPATKSKGATSEERNAQHTFAIGESVLFTNDTAIRIDSIEPVEVWPGSKYDVLLDDPRAFAVHYTYTNFSDGPAEVQRLNGLDFSAEPFDPDLDWPEGKYPEILNSTAAVRSDGIASLNWPDLEAQVGDYSLPDGESVQGVYVTYEIRKGPAKIRLEVGDYREEGHSWYLLDVP